MYFGCSPSLSHHPQMGPSSCRKTSFGLPLSLHYGELHNYFIIYYKVVIIEIKCSTNVNLNHPQTIIQGWGLLPYPISHDHTAALFSATMGAALHSFFITLLHETCICICTYTNSHTLKIEMTGICILAFGYNETIILTLYTQLIIYNKLKKYLNCHL